MKQRSQFGHQPHITDATAASSSIVNDYTIVIQEYFQKRVETWLSTVGKHVLGIKHYWLRYEFAPGRGQIHAHMLAISDNKSLQHDYYANRDNKAIQTQLLSQWVQQTFAMTASLQDETNFDRRTPSSSDPHPSSVTFHSVTDILKDTDNCLLQLQNHKCGIKCMRKQHTSQKRSAQPRCKICKAGAGMEHTPGKHDTPGFPLQGEASIVDDIRSFKKTPLSCNHPRITQTSMLMSQSWRANCDIQILLYDSDPNNPDPADIARVTDYIVAYACKGVETLQEEKRQMISLILQASEDFGDKADVQKVARQLLNKTIGEKMISKQEAMVLAGQLKLIDCSESINTVSISGYYKLREKGVCNTLLRAYCHRPNTLSHLTFHQFFHHTKNNTTSPHLSNCKYIPHYVGASSQPVYPPSQNYAKSIILLHTPWIRRFDTNQDFVSIFSHLIEIRQLPDFVLIPFCRVKARAEKHFQTKEPTNTYEEPININLSSVPQDLQDVIQLANLLPSNATTDVVSDELNFDYGKNTDWSIQHYTPCDAYKATTFLFKAITRMEEIQTTQLLLPTKTNGDKYTIDTLTEAQQDILAYVLDHLQRWVMSPTCPNIHFSPLQLTICGQGGSGKSVLIKTILTTIRTIFQRNDTCYVTAPTGSAAFSAGGRTIHSLFRIGTHNIPQTMTSTLQKRLQAQFANITTLIIDERSLISSDLLATTEKYARNTFHKGMNTNHSWGKLPLFLLVGDDFQLPPIQSGAFDVLTPLEQKLRLLSKRKEQTSARTARGEQLFLEAAQQVMTLPTSQRVLQSQKKLKEILHALRSEDDTVLSDEQIEILTTKLHIMSSTFTPQDRLRIAKDALFLFANRAPREIFNRTKLFEVHSPANPIAKIMAITIKNGRRESNNSHYDETIPPSTSFARNAQVSITGQNIMPPWGLYNGSIGTVLDIVFHPGESPNTSHQPAYVLVQFNQYVGPPFLQAFPKAVPITPVTVPCNRNHCCTRTFIPLTLAFGKTVHTFQGQNAGPVEPGQPKHPVQRIICDPGTRQFEGVNIGLLYTICSRATTLGLEDDNNGFPDSALYFIGNNMNKNRVQNITLQQNGKPYIKVIKRKRWVDYLKQHNKTSGLLPARKRELFHWATNTFISKHQLQKIIAYHSKST